MPKPINDPIDRMAVLARRVLRDVHAQLPAALDLPPPTARALGHLHDAALDLWIKTQPKDLN